MRDWTDTLIRELAECLPDAIDDDVARKLADKLRPYLAPPKEPATALLTCAQAAEQANVHVETIYRAIRHGDLPTAGRVGRSPRIAPLALEAWLAHTPSADPATPTVRRRGRVAAQPKFSLAAAFNAND